MKILIVDDDDILSHQLVNHLDACWYTTDHASDSAEAIAFLQEISYDLILLDVLLPDANGIDFCRSLRSQGIKSPIILMTASEHDDLTTGLNAGADDYIKKPFGLLELEARLKALLRRNHEIQHQILNWRGVQLDLATHQITFQRQSLPLSLREQSLVALLFQDEQRIHSQPSLLKYLWAIDDDLPGEEAVRTLIRRLRKKLEGINASDMIETVYGLGYRLNSAWEPMNPPSLSDQPLPPAVMSPVAAAETSLNAQQLQLMLLADIQMIQDLASNTTETYFHQVQRIAHRLIGSLGVLELGEAATIAQQISTQLDCRFVDRVDFDGLTQQAQLLKAAVPQISSSAAQTLLSVTSSNADAANISLTNQPNIQVLVLDDDQLILKLLQKMLQPWGIQVHVLSEPDQLLATLDRVMPDILILDLNLPDANGIELCQMLRANSQWADLSIIILTSQRDSATIRQVFDAGADDFVSKPIVPPEFMARLLNRFERRRSRQERQGRDPLTGLANQAIGSAQLATKIQQLDGAAFCLMVVQVNHLTDLAAEYGYAVRDRWLRLFALTLKQQLPEALLSRWHGGEFVLGVSLTSAELMSQLSAVQSVLQKVTVSPMQDNPVAITIGIAERSDSTVELATLVQQAMQHQRSVDDPITNSP